MKANSDIKGFVKIYCQGCECTHALNVGRNEQPKWGFNNDLNNPTFTPSLLVRTGKYVDPDFDDEGIEGLSTICHSFITDGKIQFLNDSTHKLSGKTVELLDYESWPTNQ